MSHDLFRWEVPSVCTMVVPQEDEDRDFVTFVRTYIANFGEWFDHALWVQVVDESSENTDHLHKFYSEILKANRTEVNGVVIYSLEPAYLYKNLDSWMASPESSEYFDNYLYLKGELSETSKVAYWYKPLNSERSYVIGYDSYHGVNDALKIGEGCFSYEDNYELDVWADEDDY